MAVDRITDRYHILRSPGLSRVNPRVFTGAAADLRPGTGPAALLLTSDSGTTVDYCPGPANSRASPAATRVVGWS